MLIYLLLLPLLYLAVSYITIFKMPVRLPKILRMVMGVVLLLICGLTTTYYHGQAWWVFAILVMLVINVEITSFKSLKQDRKGVAILNGITVMITVLYFILAIILYR